VSPRRIDILTAIEGVEFEQAWSERLKVEVEGMQLPVIGRMHLIANKRALGRTQDQADLERLRGDES